MHIIIVRCFSNFLTVQFHMRHFYNKYMLINNFIDLIFLNLLLVASVDTNLKWILKVLKLKTSRTTFANIQIPSYVMVKSLFSFHVFIINSYERLEQKNVYITLGAQIAE